MKKKIFAILAVILMTFLVFSTMTVSAGPTVHGTVTGKYVDDWGVEHKNVPLEGITVKITNPKGGTTETETRKDGTFSINVQERGKYTVKLSGSVKITGVDNYPYEFKPSASKKQYPIKAYKFTNTVTGKRDCAYDDPLPTTPNTPYAKLMGFLERFMNQIRIIFG